MEEQYALDLVDVARSRPNDPIGEIEAALADATVSTAVKSICARALCEATRWTRGIEESVEHGRASIEFAKAANREDLVAESTLTCSGSIFLSGDLPGALILLAELDGHRDELIAAKVDHQRSTYLARSGNLAEAEAGFRRALPLFEAHGEKRFMAFVHQNIGMILTERGDYEESIDHLYQAGILFDAVGLELSRASVQHTVGRCLAYLGQLPASWEHLNRAEATMSEISDAVWEVRGTKLEVLIQAGLFHEAVQVAVEAEDELATQGQSIPLAEVRFWKAVALLELDRWDAARISAESSAAMFEAQKRDTWGLLAQSLSLRGVVEGDRTHQPALIRDLSNRLCVHGQYTAAAAMWAALSHTDPDDALEGFAEVRANISHPPFALLLTEHEAKARQRWSVGDNSGAFESTLAAMDIVERRQSALAASDLVAGSTAAARSVLKLGLDHRLSGASPRDAFDWIERSRRLGVTRNRTTRSSESQRLIGQLRQLHVRLRSEASGSHSDTWAEIRQLEQSLSDLDRAAVTSRRENVNDQRSSQPDRTRHIRAHLFDHDGEMRAAVLDPEEGAYIANLGTTTSWWQEANALRNAALRHLALPSDRNRARVHRSAPLLRRMKRTISPNSHLELSPPRELLDVPWGLVVESGDEPISVHLFFGRTHRQQPRLDRVKIVLGPDLDASQEGQGVADIYGISFGEAPQTVQSALALLSNADLAHFICHGSRRSDQAMFAHLRMGDGDLTGFDIEGLDRSPETVVFSACDAGVLEPAAGSASFGIATALFRNGTNRVVAPVCEIPDDEITSRLFVGLHRKLADGAMPEVALAALRIDPDPELAFRAGLVSCYRCG